MHRRSWKRCESRIAEIVGGRRIPVTGRKGADVLTDRLAVEVKARKSLPAYLLAWIEQAEAGAPDGRLPIVVLHQAGRPHTDDLVMLRLSDFVEWLGGCTDE